MKSPRSKNFIDPPGVSAEMPPNPMPGGVQAALDKLNTAEAAQARQQKQSSTLAGVIGLFWKWFLGATGSSNFWQCQSCGMVYPKKSVDLGFKSFKVEGGHTCGQCGLRHEASDIHDGKHDMRDPDAFLAQVLADPNNAQWDASTRTWSYKGQRLLGSALFERHPVPRLTPQMRAARKGEAGYRAQRWWDSPAIRTRLAAKCDSCSAQIPRDSGYLCQPRKYSTEVLRQSPDLLCESCYDRQNREPWHPAGI